MENDKMTVKELIEKLETLPKDKVIEIEYWNEPSSPDLHGWCSRSSVNEITQENDTIIIKVGFNE